MTTYDRFEAVLGHRMPDKLPFYFPTIECTVASRILGREINSGGDSLHFREELSWLDGDNAHEEFVHKYREDAVELNRTLRADVVRQTWRSKARPSKRLDEYTLLFGDETGSHRIKRFFPENQTYGVILDKTGPEDPEELAISLKSEIRMECKVSDEELYATYKDQLDFKKLAKPYFPTIIGGLDIGIPMTDTLWLEMTILEPELLAEYFMHSAEVYIHHVAWLHRQGFNWINGGRDLASSAGPVFSPRFFSRALVPALKRISDECGKYGIFYCYRTDGNIWSIADYMFRDSGIQAYGEVDREAGMTVGSLRERYPDLIILGNNSSSTLHRGTEKEVREETRAALLESGGRNYIPGPSNAIMHGTPVENIYAMIDEIEKYKPGQ